MADPTVPVAPLPQAVQATVIQELSQVLAAIGTVLTLPQNLPPPSRQVVLTGTALAPPADPAAAPQPQVAVIQTALGTLTLNLTTAIAPGPVTVQIQPGSPPSAAVLILTPASQPPVQTATQTLQSNPLVTTAQAVSLPPAPPVAIGQVLQGVFIPTATEEPVALPTSPLTQPAIATSAAPASAELPASVLPVSQPVGPQPTAISSASPLLPSSPLQAQESNNAIAAPVVQTTLPPPIPQAFLVVGISIPETQSAALPAVPIAAPVPGAGAEAEAPVSLSPAGNSTAPANATPFGAQLPLSPLPAAGILPPLAIQAEAVPLSGNPAPGGPATPSPVAPFSPSTGFQLTGQAVSATLLSPESGNSVIPASQPSSVPAAPVSTAAASITVPAAAVSVTPAAADIPPPAPSPLAAVVIAATSSQQPVLSVPNGTIIISQPLAVHPGTTLTLQVLSPDQLLKGSSPAIPLPLSRQSWPALQQGLSLLAANPATTAAIARFIPTLGQDFITSFVAYLTKRSDIDKDADPILHDLKIGEMAAPGLRAVLGQMQADVLGKNAAPASTQTWQAYPLPVLTGAELSLIQLYVRQQIDPEEAAKDPKKRRRDTTRFLLEVSPSELGPVQLDGFLRKESRAVQPVSPHLDLIVRSEATIPAAGAAELQGLFINALESTGLTGRLSFQFGRENFVQPESGVGGQIEVKA